MCARRNRSTGLTQAVYYRDRRGSEPVYDFIATLSAKQAAKIDGFIEEYLNGKASGSPPPDFPITSQIEGEMRELRVRFARSRFRVLYQQSASLIVLLHAFEKSTGAVPSADIRTARLRMNDFVLRMNQQPRLRPRAAGGDAPRKGSS